MSTLSPELKAHLASGATSTCNCWALTRRDGVLLGFTDHDGPLSFDGIEFQADAGLSALALQQTTGLSVDNTEALGALNSTAIKEEDIEAGRYDGAEIRAWLVNWADVTQRQLKFRGTIGELRRRDGTFEAELRGLTDALNMPIGNVYQKPCGAVLGDNACAFNLGTTGYFELRVVEAVENRQAFRFTTLDGIPEGWFKHGRMVLLDGPAAGLIGLIKRDKIDGAERLIELWQPLRADVSPGNQLRLEAGCDKRMETCRLKFNNLLNYQGFPDIPGDDWSISTPRRNGNLSGKSRRS